jgi:hypothetical protein
LEDQCVIDPSAGVAAGVFGPGHLGELTQLVDAVLVDAVVAETGTGQRRLRLLPARVVVYFVLGLALFEQCGYRLVWSKLVAGLPGWSTGRSVVPSVSGLCRARRRVGPAPLRALFEAVCGPVAWPDTPGVFWRRLRLVAIDATTVHVPEAVAGRGGYATRGSKRRFGYPLLRLTAVVECGTRALVGAVFGPEREGEVAAAGRLLPVLGAGMLVLADAGYDAWRLLADIAGTGARYLCRGKTQRAPLVLRRLPDGSYLTALDYGRIRVRVIEAWITVTYADGSVRREQWRLLTDLLEHRRYPAAELVSLYHERWEIETTYYSIKHTMLDGRVLRSRRPADIDQEMYGLLVVYQAIITASTDAVAVHARRSSPGPGGAASVGGAGGRDDPDRASFTVALNAACDQVVLAAAVLANPDGGRIGPIGHAVLANLQPARRHRARARTVKNPTSKYGPNAGQKPATDLPYTITTKIEYMEHGLTARRHR